ncbi:hypothetical protein SAMN05421544_11047 [Riemerella columbipharyngis]|uniref:Uncharacterized protein n=2 Tax=Riemerella columbipharyngis TaxID=1071918 RepID=A0A1G7DAQ8_9FLAO|nr:hypothetical protein SAMN05421544_11047 [Riemerella columbipharyngis]
MVRYCDLYATTSQNVNAPLFAVDNKYYHSIFRDAYIEKFRKDLMGDNKYPGSCYIFKRNSLSAIKEDFFALK